MSDDLLRATIDANKKLLWYQGITEKIAEKIPSEIKAEEVIKKE